MSQIRVRNLLKSINKSRRTNYGHLIFELRKRTMYCNKTVLSSKVESRMNYLFKCHSHFLNLSRSWKKRL